MTPTTQDSRPLSRRLTHFAREAIEGALRRPRPAPHPPLAALLAELSQRGVALAESHALLLCCPSASSPLARTLAEAVARLTIWERRRAVRAMLAELTAELPILSVETVDPQAAADYATIYGATDDFRSHTAEAALGPFDLIVVGAAEHQTLFPSLLRLLSARGVLIVTTEPVLVEQPPRGGNAASFDEARLARREAFYETRDPLRLTVPQLAGAYVRCAVAEGFAPEWYVDQADEGRRLLALKLSRFSL